VKRADVEELHYITRICNVPSILRWGILCHNKAKKVKHQSVADPCVQSRRKGKCVPGGKKLHDYANLYFNARNPMMFKRKSMHQDLTIIRVKDSILDEPDIVVSDGNAASSYARFFPAEEGIAYLSKSLVFAKNWRHKDRIEYYDQIEYYRRKFAICAEALMPCCVRPDFIVGMYISCLTSHQKVVDLVKGSRLAKCVSLAPDLFFQ